MMKTINSNDRPDKKVSITPSGFFGNSKDMIVELENFMTEEEVVFLENAARNITIWDVTESHANENGKPPDLLLYH